MNWGYKLFFTFLVFGAGIGYLVIRSFGTTYELVESDYYNNELAYQQVIDGSNRAGALHTSVTVAQTADGIQLQLPGEMSGKTVKGSLWFYCDYDQTKDKHLPILADTSGLQFIEKGLLSPGNYMVKISWECEGKSYYSEKKLHLN